MKSVTEFQSSLLTRGIEAKTSLGGEGKTPEEIQAGLGQAFRMEGERLGHFVKALDIAAQHPGLSRVVVVSLAEGEQAPAKAVKIEEHYYVPEFRVLSQPSSPGRDDRGRGRGGPGRGGGGGRRR